MLGLVVRAWYVKQSSWHAHTAASTLLAVASAPAPRLWKYNIEHCQIRIDRGIYGIERPLFLEKHSASRSRSGDNDDADRAATRASEQKYSNTGDGLVQHR